MRPIPLSGGKPRVLPVISLPIEGHQIGPVHLEPGIRSEHQLRDANFSREVLAVLVYCLRRVQCHGRNLTRLGWFQSDNSREC